MQYSVIVVGQFVPCIAMVLCDFPCPLSLSSLFRFPYSISFSFPLHLLFISLLYLTFWPVVHQHVAPRFAGG